MTTRTLTPQELAALRPLLQQREALTREQATIELALTSILTLLGAESLDLATMTLKLHADNHD